MFICRQYWKMICCLLSGLTTSVLLATPPLLAWSEGICKANRFSANASAGMKISDDEKEKAVRFEVDFKPGRDAWVYPFFRFRGGESLEGVEQIRFDIRAEQGTPGAGYKASYVMIGEEKPFFVMPSPEENYQTVVIDVSKSVKAPEAAKHLRIGMNPKDPRLTFFIRNLEFRGKNTAPVDTALAVQAVAPGAAFIQGESLAFTRKPFAQLSVEWTLRDWKGEIIKTGKWAAGNGELLLEALPNGYYQLEIASPEIKFTGFRSFAVVPEPNKRPENPDMFYAVDSAQSWLARPDANNPRRPEDAYAVVSDVARRSGVQMVRERLSWRETEYAPGKFDWKQYKTNADLLAERGILISGMYHDTPKWVSNASGISDLYEVYQFAKKTAETFKGQMYDWEFWNEQDGHLLAWDYAAAMKAAYLGFKAADPSLPVAIGGYSAMPSQSAYADSVMKSGTGEYFDIFNVHSYYSIRTVPAMLKDIQGHLTRYGAENRPIWFTEVGTRTDGAGKLDSYIPGLKMHSPDQEIVMAEFLQKILIAMQMNGVDKAFFFVLPPYNENGGNKDWGLMRHDFTVKPGYVALATLIDRLGNAVPEGEVVLGDGLKGYLFRQNDGTHTLMYWSHSPIEPGPQTDKATCNLPVRKFLLPSQNKVLKGVDVFGTPFETNGLEVTATRLPSFLDGVRGMKVSQPFSASSKAGPQADETVDKTIIFRTELSKDFTPFTLCEGVDVKKDDAEFKLLVWNLSEQPKVGRIMVSGGKFSGIPEKISVPAFGKTEIELTFTPEVNKKFEGELRIDGVFGERRTSPLVIPVQSLKALAERGRQVVMPQLMDPKKWRGNAAGKMTISYDETEKALVFRTLFNPAVPDKWTYPEYVLDLPQDSFKGAVGVAMDVKVSDPSGIRQMLMMAVLDKDKEGGISSHLRINSPTDSWGERFAPFQLGFEPSQVQQIRLGVNSRVSDITWWVRNVRIIYAAP